MGYRAKGNGYVLRSTAGDAKLLIVLPALGAGGAERVATMLSNHWAHEGRSIVIVTFEAPETKPYYPVDDRIDLRPLDVPSIPKPKWRAVQQTWRRVRALRAVIDETQPDVILSFLTKTNIIALLAAPKTLPVIISERNNPYLQRFDPMWRMMRALTFPGAHSFVAMTPEAIAYYPEHQRPRARVIPNPVSLPADWQDRRSGRTLTAVGRLHPQKRFDLLIDAFAKIADAQPDWQLVIWGEGSERAALEAQTRRLGLQHRLTLAGLTPEPASWIETADILVMSSDYEGWGNVLTEALAAGVPAISTDCDFGPGEIIDHDECGLLVPCGDADALSKALTRVMENPDLRVRFAANGLEKARRFQVDAIARKWDEVITDACAIHPEERWLAATPTQNH